jgi:hypothetical protein
LRHLETTYTERGSAGNIVALIKISSDLSDKRDSAKLSFAVQGTSKLVLPTLLYNFAPTQITNATRETESLAGLPQAAQAWLLPKSREDAAPNLKEGPVLAISGLSKGQEFSFDVRGRDFRSQNVPLVGLLSGENGIVGVSAELHLPSLR